MQHPPSSPNRARTKPLPQITSDPTLETLEANSAGACASRQKYKRKKSARQRLADAFKANHESQLYNLTLDINGLQQQIHELRLRRDLLCTRLQRQGPKHPSAIGSTIQAYFKGFKHGFRAPDFRHGDFVRSIVSDTFSLGGTANGVDMLLEQWRRYSVVFEIRDVILISSELVVLDMPSLVNPRGCVVFKCAAASYGVFTRIAVDTVFPNARTRLWELLQVLGSSFVCPMLFHIYFDLHGRFLRQDLNSDFFGAVTNLLDGNACMAGCFVEGALVGEESMIGGPYG